MEFEHKKSLGQHFLNSDIVPIWMCEPANIEPGDIVVEIGPGSGVLTKELLKRGARVLALEADHRAVALLEDRFVKEIAKGELKIYHGDARTWDPKMFNLEDHSFKVVANIPYYLSGMLFRVFLSHHIQPNSLVFLVQKEVAKRVTSNIKKGQKESLLSLSAQVYGEPEYVQSVPRGHFTPPPKVDSGIVLIRNVSRDKLRGVNEKLFFEILHLGFGQKRKQLLGNLAAQYDREILTNTFSTLELPNDVRAEDVPLEKWLNLTKKLAEIIIL